MPTVVTASTVTYVLTPTIPAENPPTSSMVQLFSGASAGTSLSGQIKNVGTSTIFIGRKGNSFDDFLGYPLEPGEVLPFNMPASDTAGSQFLDVFGPVEADVLGRVSVFIVSTETT